MLPDTDLPPGSAERLFSVLEMQDLKKLMESTFTASYQIFSSAQPTPRGASCCCLDFVFPGCQNVDQRGNWSYVFRYFCNEIHFQNMRGWPWAEDGLSCDFPASSWCRSYLHPGTHELGILNLAFAWVSSRGIISNQLCPVSHIRGSGNGWSSAGDWAVCLD